MVTQLVQPNIQHAALVSALDASKDTHNQIHNFAQQYGIGHAVKMVIIVQAVLVQLTEHVHHVLQIIIYFKGHVLPARICPIAQHVVHQAVQVVPIAPMYFINTLADCAVQYYPAAIHVQALHLSAQLA